MNSGDWGHPALVAKSNFKHKSLSDWSLNIAVGCAHACRFCYVPSVSTNKMSGPLATLGVVDPDAEWGDYVFLRSWSQQAFRASLKKAEQTPASELTRDGNRAVMLCTTTDPYQTVADRDWNTRRRDLVRACLQTILKESTLNVRVLTRSPLAKEDFELYRLFGDRLLFGMSLPTLDNRLARVFEPHAPAPAARLATLEFAKTCGLNVYVAVAPTYPGADARGLKELMEAVADLEPVTVFSEPINIRADNVERLRVRAEEVGVELDLSMFADKLSWRRHSLTQLLEVHKAAAAAGVGHKLHLWPDQDLLGTKVEGGGWGYSGDGTMDKWIRQKWERVSEWPGRGGL